MGLRAMVDRLPAGSYMLAVVFALAVILWMTVVAADWNPVLGGDARDRYYPALAPTMKESSPFVKYIMPFLYNGSVDLLSAVEPKPIFIGSVRAWIDLGRVFVPDETRLDVFVSSFIAATVVGTFVSCLLLGAALEAPWAGLLGGIMTILNAWMVATFYYTSYTGLSLIFLILAYACFYGRRSRPLSAGALMAANLLVNQSVCLYVLVLPFAALVWPASRKDKVARIGQYALGGILFWAAAELVVLFGVWWSGEESHSRIWTLLQYLGKSMDHTVAFRDMFKTFWGRHLFWNFLPVASLAFIVMAGVAFFGLRKQRQLESGEKQAIELLLFVLAALFLIEVRTGPKFARTYSLVVPFLFLFVAVEGEILWRKFQDWDWERGRGFVCRLTFVVTCAVGLVLHSLVAGPELLRLKHAALDLRDEVTASPAPYYYFGQDNYVFTHWYYGILDNPSRPSKQFVLIDSPCDIVADEGLLIMSPVNRDLFQLDQRASLPFQSDHGTHMGTCSGRSWMASLEKSVPFYTHLPYTVVEDPPAAKAMIVDGHLGWDDYDSGDGQTTIWRIKFTPLPLAAGS